MADKNNNTVDALFQRHHFWLQRLIPSLSRDVIKIIDSNNPELRGEILEFLDKNDGYSLTKRQEEQLIALRNKVARIRGSAISEAEKKYSSDMVELATKEQLYVKSNLEKLGSKSLALSSASAIEKMVERQPFVGQTIQQMYQSLSANDTERIVKTVRQGLAEGMTRQQIENAIFGTKKLNYKDGVLNTTRNSVNNPNTNSGITRTTVNAVTSESRSMLYRANSDIIPREQFTAVIDGRTTFFCSSHHGLIYKIGEGPQLPVHYNERSIYTPVIDGLDIESTQPAVYDTRTRKERERDFRKESRETGESIGDIRRKWKNRAVGRVSTKMTWNDVLESKPSFAKEYLGPTRYKLWKDGNLQLSDLHDAFANPLSLDEIYRNNPSAFKKADIAKP